VVVFWLSIPTVFCRKIWLESINYSYVVYCFDEYFVPVYISVFVSALCGLLLCIYCRCMLSLFCSQKSKFHHWQVREAVVPGHVSLVLKHGRKFSVLYLVAFIVVLSTQPVVSKELSSEVPPSWYSYQSGARCGWFAHGSADDIASPSCHCTSCKEGYNEFCGLLYIQQWHTVNNRREWRWLAILSTSWSSLYC